jgi:tetratricopeptide (TPR) repeat protein
MEGPLSSTSQDSVLRPSRAGIEPESGSPPADARGLGHWVSVAAGFGIPFLLIFTLAVGSGGYDLVLRSQVGIIVWWILLLGLGAGLLPVMRPTRAGLFTVVAFGALVAWTALATLAWTDSAESSVVELSRTVSIFGAFLLMLLIQGRAGLNRTLAAVGAAAAAVAVIALADRFDPGLLPFGSSDPLPEGYPVARLYWPLEYWNGLAALMAIGLGPLLWMAGSARHVAARAAAAGAIPLVALATYMTASRGGTASAALALVTLMVLFPERLKLILTSVIPGLGALVLVMAVNDRPEVRDLIPGDLAASQGTELIWICLAVFAAAAGFQALLTGLMGRGSITVPVVSRRLTVAFGVALGSLVLVVVVAGFASGFLSDRWGDFKQPADDQSNVGRLASISSGERYLYWDAAMNAAKSEKLTGIGPGTFEFWWAQKGEGQFARDAHNLYLESLAEMGPLALVLVLLLIFGPIAYGVRLSLMRRPAGERAGLAAATAGMAGFALAAGVDWSWEQAVLPIAFFALAAAVLGRHHRLPESDQDPATAAGADRASGSPLRPWARALAAVGAALAIAVLYIPMAGTQAYESSQAKYRDGDLEGALAEAERSTDLQPWAASPRVQQAQLLALLGRRQEAVASAREAIDREGGNWRNWLVLSQVLADSPARSASALERARALNPRSAYLQELAPPDGGSSEGQG